MFIAQNKFASRAPGGQITRSQRYPLLSPPIAGGSHSGSSLNQGDYHISSVQLMCVCVCEHAAAMCVRVCARVSVKPRRVLTFYLRKIASKGGKRLS